MLRCYFDESGTEKPDSESGKKLLRRLTIGGCFSDATRWHAFEVEWRQALANESASMFHMNEFENRQGEFKEDLGWTQPKRERFLENLLDIIDRNVSGFAGSTYLGVDQNLKEAYLRTAKMAVLNMRNLLPEEIVDDVAILFAANEQAKPGRVADYFSAFKELLPEFGAISIGSPKEVLPLQAADLIAYEIRKNEGVWISDPTKPPHRYPLRRLITSRHPHQWKIGP